MLTLVLDASSNPVDDLAAALERALNAVKSSGSAGQSEEREDGQGRRLVAEFDALAGSERDQVAQALTQLWDAFNERFGGLQGFLSAEFADRDDYVKQLERAAERMASGRHCAAARYYQATALMLAYIRAVSQQQSLGSRVIEAVHRGRVLSREGLPMQNAETIRQLPSPVLADSLLPSF